MSITYNPTLDTRISMARFYALVIDILLLGVITFFVNTCFGTMHITGGTVPTSYTSTYTVDWPWISLIYFAYFFLQEVFFSTTIGKKLAGLMVVDFAGQRLTLWRALVRNLLLVIDIIPGFFLVGGLFVLFTQRHQRLGDLAARTLVVDRASVPASTLTARPGKVERFAVALGVIALLACAAYGYFARPAQVIGEMQATKNSLFYEPTYAFKTGTPTWGFGTVTYPVQYQTQEDKQTYYCHGQIVMNFIPMRGWSSTTGTGSSCQVSR